MQIMFTGIISDIGEVVAITQKGDSCFRIACCYELDSIKIGASIACQGVCLTVIACGHNEQGSAYPTWFDVEVSQETIRCTLLGAWQIGTKINLERALAYGDELGGYVVSGHVDGLATLITVEQEGDSHVLTFEADPIYAPFFVDKGCITINGIALTINKTEAGCFTINIIPHTWKETQLHLLPIGGKVHMEVDMLARYAAKMVQCGNIDEVLATLERPPFIVEN